MNRKTLIILLCIVVVIIFVVFKNNKNNNKSQNEDSNVINYTYEQSENGAYIVHDEEGNINGVFETEDGAQTQIEFMQANPGYEANPPLTDSEVDIYPADLITE